MSSGDPSKPGRAARLLEPLLLRTALARVRGYPEPAAERARGLYRSAASRRASASRLAEDRDHAAALTLQRESLTLLGTAISLVHKLHSLPTTLTATEAFEHLEQLAALPKPESPHFDLVRRALSETDPAALDSWPAKDLRRARASADKFLRRLQTSFEPRGLRRLKVVRVLRIVAAVGVPVLAAVASTQLFLAPVNVARDKPVIASSTSIGLPPTAVVDGIIDAACGVRTRPEKNPWVRIDLLKHRPIRSVLLYPAAELPKLPLVIELSADGENFREVARRDHPMTAGLRWRLAMNDTVGRYLRVRVLSDGAHLCLAEVEVFAPRDR